MHIILQILTQKMFFAEISEIVVNFLFTLISKCIKHKNLYSSIIFSNSNDSKDYDFAIFQLMVEIFQHEFQYKKREVKSKIRRSMLLCLDLDHFNSEGNQKCLSKLIDGLVIGLQFYYKDFRDFDANLQLTKVKIIITN